MKAQLLKRLADVADVSKLDLTPGAMTLAPVEEGTLGWYAGPYSAGGIVVPVLEALTEPVAIAATEFRDLVALFDDDQDVRLKADETALVLTAGKRRVSIRYLGKPEFSQWQVIRSVEGPYCSGPRDVLLRELGTASGIASVSLTNPILTGIRLFSLSGAAAVEAANGSSLVFESGFAADSKEQFDALIPAKDIMTAIGVVREEEILTLILQSRGNAGFSLIVKGKSSILKLAILAGNWPKMEQLKKLEFTEALSLPTSAIRSLAIAARAYKASNDAIIRPSSTPGFVILETQESEMGQFQEGFPGEISRTYVLDVGDLDQAAKLSNETLQLSFAEQMARCIVGARKLFIVCRSR